MMPVRSGPEVSEAFDNEKRMFLLAVDAGVKTGLALYNNQGQLCWYRSHNMGSISSLRKAAYRLLHSVENLRWLVIEGGGPVSEAWVKEAVKLNLNIIRTDAGEWRKALLHPREFRNSAIAKQSAISLSKPVIEKSDAPSVNRPDHDAAEAILIGLWGCGQAGFLADPLLFHRRKGPER
jgi:hypothetical protein